MRLGALWDGHHGALRPDMNRLCPVEALYAAALDGEYVFRRRHVDESCSAVAAEIAVECFP